MLIAAPEGLTPHTPMSMATLLATVKARSQVALLPFRVKTPVIVALRVPFVFDTGPTVCTCLWPSVVFSSCCRLAQAGQPSAEVVKNVRASCADGNDTTIC